VLLERPPNVSALEDASQRNREAINSIRGGEKPGPNDPLDAGIGLAVPGRPIGPWSRRTGAPEASATGRNRNRMLTRLLTGRATTPRDERAQDGTTLRRLPSLEA
jgi:hypothetical protein